MYRSAWSKVFEHWEAGESAYGAGLHTLAVEHYREATALSESSDEVPRWYKGIMRRSLADELTTLERLREALAVLSEIPKTAVNGFRECCVYGSMTDQIEIAQRLPVALTFIENAYTQAEDYFRAAGDATWRGRLLYYRSELLFERGLYTEALSAAQEGAAYLRDDCPKLYPSSHMRGLFNISLALGDLEGAKRYQRKWVEHYDKEDKRQPIRGVQEYLMQSQLARAEGRAEDAVEWARRGAQMLLAAADWGDTHFALVCEQVRAYILDGRHVTARELLARLAPIRRSESWRRRYVFALLRGDYHLARARAAAGLPQLDDQFGTSGAHADEVGAPTSFESEVARARRAYGAALKAGVWIDEKLECSVRTEEVNRRLDRLSLVSRVASTGAD